MNVLTAHLRITIDTLLSRGVGQREIERRTGVDRKTIRRYAHLAQLPGVAPALSGTTGKLPHPGHRLCRPSLPARTCRRVNRTWVQGRAAWEALPQGGV